MNTIIARAWKPNIRIGGGWVFDSILYATIHNSDNPKYDRNFRKELAAIL